VIVEHALLPVRTGMSDEFRSAFSDAKSIISAMPGYQRWRELLHRFYEPFPLVEHFEQVERV
jgi:heme-degrading monooxygenase HmoA